MSKSQITIYVILGIIILGVVIFFLALTQTSTFQLQDFFVSNEETLPIKSYIDECLKMSTEETADYISLQGGYYNGKNNSWVHSWAVKIPYYYHYQAGEKYPSMNDLKTELEQGVTKNFLRCIETNPIIDRLGYKMKVRDEPNVEFIFNEEEITTNLRYPVQLEKDGKVIYLENFRADIKHPLLNLYRNSIDLVTEIKQDLEIIPTSYLIDFSLENEIYFEIIDMKNGDVFYSLIKNKNTTSEVVYNFLVKHGKKTQNLEELEFNSTMSFEIPSGYLFETQLSTNLPNSRFYSYTDLFKISIDGNISFTPEIEDEGLHFIMIKAENNNTEKFSFLSVNITGTKKPRIENILSQTITKRETFTYQVKLIEEINTALFYFASGFLNESIDILTGNITYKANETLEKDINITVIDINGNMDIEDFRLRVVE